MCLAVPGKIVEIDGNRGIVEVMGNRIRVLLTLLETPQIGEYVLIHAGMAIGKVSQNEAQETLELLEEMSRVMGEE